MKKKLLMVLFPVILMVAGSMAVWANEQSSMQPGCNKCAQMEKKAACANCPNAAKMEQGGCANCAKMKGAEATPAGAPGCDKCAKMQQGCANCTKMKGAEANPAAAPGCEKCAKMQQAEPRPCCPKAKPE